MTGKTFNAASATPQDGAETVKSREELGRLLLQEAGRETPILQKMTELVAAGADLEARNELGQTPLLAAVYRQNLAAAALLLDSGADKYARAGEAAALFYAVARHDLKMVSLLLDKGVDPERDTYTGGLTALMWAAHVKKKDIAEEIARRGGEVYRKNMQDRGRTALDYAEDNNKPHIASSLRRIDDRKKEIALQKEADERKRLAGERAAAEKAALEAICRTGLATEKPVVLKRPLRFAKPHRGN